VSELVQFLPQLIGLGILLLCSAFFSGSETALFSLTRTQAKRMSDGTPAERAATTLLHHPQRLLSTILTGNLVVNVLIASLIASLARELSGGEGEGWGMTAAVVVTSFLLLIFGEVTPKTLAAAHPHSISRLVALPLTIVAWIVRPFRTVLRWVADLILAALGIHVVPGWGDVTREEVAAMLAVGETTGATTNRERELAEHILDIATVQAHDIMVPRTEIRGVSDTLTLAEAYDVSCRTRHSRLPVYGVDLDHIWGFLSVATLPRWRNSEYMTRPLAELRPDDTRGAEAGAETPVYPVYVVPENAKIDRILDQMRKIGTQIVVLVDEYGGTAGMLTMHDILSEILGTIVPPGEERFDSMVATDEYILVEGRTHLRELNRALDPPVPEDGTEAETAGGYVMELAGRIPRAGDVVKDDVYRFQVVRMSGRRIGVLRVEKLQTDERAEGEKCS